MTERIREGDGGAPEEVFVDDSVNTRPSFDIPDIPDTDLEVTASAPVEATDDAPAAASVKDIDARPPIEPRPAPAVGRPALRKSLLLEEKPELIRPTPSTPRDTPGDPILAKPNPTPISGSKPEKRALVVSGDAEDEGEPGPLPLIVGSDTYDTIEMFGAPAEEEPETAPAGPPTPPEKDAPEQTVRPDHLVTEEPAASEDDEPTHQSEVQGDVPIKGMTGSGKTGEVERLMSEGAVGPSIIETREFATFNTEDEELIQGGAETPGESEDAARAASSDAEAESGDSGPSTIAATEADDEASLQPRHLDHIPDRYSVPFETEADMQTVQTLQDRYRDALAEGCDPNSDYVRDLFDRYDAANREFFGLPPREEDPAGVQEEAPAEGQPWARAERQEPAEHRPLRQKIAEGWRSMYENGQEEARNAPATRAEAAVDRVVEAWMRAVGTLRGYGRSAAMERQASRETDELHE